MLVVRVASQTAVVACAAALGCGPAFPATESGASASTTTSGASTVHAETETAAETTSSTTRGDDVTGGSLGATTGGFEGSGGNGFLPRDTDGPLSEKCSIWTQDCPPGQKCAPWVHEGSYWSATRCVPVDPEPNEPGETCTAESGGNSGVDSCMRGSMCWDVDPKTGEGVCVAHCVGSEAAPLCEDPGTACSISGDGFLTLCFPACDPLDAEPCSIGEGCYPIDTGFICAPDASGKGGGVFERCEFVNGCDAGLSCVMAERLEACSDPQCCTPYCDLNAPVCPASTVCNPYADAGRASPGSEDVGVCTDEMPE